MSTNIDYLGETSTIIRILREKNSTSHIREREAIDLLIEQGFEFIEYDEKIGRTHFSKDNLSVYTTEKHECARLEFRAPGGLHRETTLRALGNGYHPTPIKAK